MNAIQPRALRAALPSLLCVVVFGIGWTALSSRNSDRRSNGELSGKVIVAGRPVVGAAVSLYVASTGKPSALAHAITSVDGGFTIDVSSPPTSSNRDFYVIVQSGRVAADGGRDPNGGLTLLAVLGAADRAQRAA